LAPKADGNQKTDSPEPPQQVRDDASAEELGAVGAQEFSFEQALERLRQINQEFERGELPLQQALDLYQEGIALAKRCEALLEQARQVVAKVLETPAGGLQEEEFEPEGGPKGGGAE